MIFLEHLFELPNYTGSPDTTLIEISQTVPAMVPLLLFFVYFVVLLGGSGLQNARTGNPDFALWSVIGSLSALIMCLIMSVVGGILLLDYLVITVVVVIFSGIWFFLSQRPTEV